MSLARLVWLVIENIPSQTSLSTREKSPLQTRSFLQQKFLSSLWQ